MTNTRSLSPETTGEWPTDPNSYQHNKPSVTVLNFNVCLIYQTKIKISNDGCIKQFDSPSLEKIYVQTNLWLEFSRRRSTPTSCNTLLHNGTGQAHTVGSTNITTPVVKGILVLEQHRSICKANQEGTFLDPERKRDKTCNQQPCKSLTRKDDFLSLQHSYSKFGVFRTILPTNATRRKQ